MELISKTIGMCLADRVEKTPDSTAIETERRNYSWRELDRVSDCMAVRMHNLGIQKGTHVGIWGTNTTNWVITFLALEKLGANVARYYAAEIDKYAIKTTQANFPDTIQLGDAFRVREDGWRPVFHDGNGV